MAIRWTFDALNGHLAKRHAAKREALAKEATAALSRDPARSQAYLARTLGLPLADVAPPYDVVVGPWLFLWANGEHVCKLGDREVAALVRALAG